MSYFAAALARTAQGWHANDVDLDDVDGSDALAELLRKNADDDRTVLLLLEQEDHWFALVRVDGEEDPRVFVSDALTVRRSTFGDVLLPDDDVDLDTLVPAYDEEEADQAADDDDESETHPDAGPAGDVDLLADLGTPADDLEEMSGEDGLLPTDALARVAERLGCLDELEALR